MTSIFFAGSPASRPMTAPRPSTSLFRPGDNCCAVARAGRLSFLVDGAAYFEAFMRAAERAERAITILAWDFDSGTVLNPGAERPVTLGEFLDSLARRRRRLQIRVLDWDYPLVFGTDRELSPLYGLSWRPHRRVDFRYDDTHPLAGSQHQKIVIIDDKFALIGGLDLACKRWDTPEHKPDDPRRTSGGKPYPPFHDLMVALDGEAAVALAEVVRQRWLNATGKAIPPVTTAGDPWPPALKADVTRVDVGIARTMPANNGSRGVREVERLYLDMIARARRRIYIENQYFTSDSVGKALAARLAEPDGPEIVLVTRLLSHGWLEEMTMHVLRTRLIRELRAADRHGRFHVYYPHLEGLAEGTCIDIHSKMMAVDEEWLRIGSANISNRSMGLDSECDIVIEANGEARVAEVVTGFRDRLLAEHLEVPAAAVSRHIEAAGSIHGAIEALGSSGRSLRPLEKLKDWPEAMVAAVGFTDPEKPVALDMLLEQFTPDIELRRHIPMWKGALAIAALAIALLLVWRFTPLADIVTAESVTSWAEDFGTRWWAPVALVLAYTPASLVMFPRPLLTLAAAVAFGPVLGFSYAIAGVLLAALATYLLGRTLRRETVRRIAGERLNRVSHVMRTHGLPAMVALRLVPVAPFAVVNVVAGAIRIKLWHFILGTFLGMLPGALAASFYGDQLKDALGDSTRINYWIAGGVLVALAGIGWGVRRWFKSIEASGGDQAAGSRPSQTAER